MAKNIFDFLKPEEVQTLQSGGSLSPDTAQNLLSKMSPEQQKEVEKVVLQAEKSPAKEKVAEAMQNNPRLAKPISQIESNLPVPQAVGAAPSNEEVALNIIQNRPDDVDAQNEAMKFLIQKKKDAEEIERQGDLQRQVAAEKAQAKLDEYNANAAELASMGINVPQKKVDPAAAQQLLDQETAASEEKKQIATLPTNAEVEAKAAPVRDAAAQQAANQLTADEAMKKEADEQVKAQQKLLDEDKAAQERFLQENKGSNQWVDAIAIMLGAWGSGLTGKENPVIDIINRRNQRRLEEKKMSMEQALADKKIELEKAQLVAKDLEAKTDNQLKKAQMAKIYGELEQEKNKTDLQRQIQAKINSNDGIKDPSIIPDEKIQARMVLMPNGKWKPAVSAEAATEIRKYYGETVPAISGVKRLLVNIKDRSIIDKMSLQQRAAIATEVKALVGQLRLPFTGPGAMTDKEYERLLETVGDPNKLTSIDSIERVKLETVLNKLNTDLASKYRAAGVNVGTPISPAKAREQSIDLLQRANPNMSREKVEAVFEKNTKRKQNK